ncbi:Rv1733c family protein [Streptomyces sp. NPDC055186]
MARTRGARPRRAWSWRWRKNPLRRRSDLTEAWLLLATLVLALLAGVFTGLAAAGAVDGSLAERRAQARTVQATLVGDAARALPAPVAENGDGSGRVWAKVRWTAPDGAVRTGRAETDSGSRAGSVVTVWTDGKGHLVSEPPGGADARFQIVMAGLTVAAASGGLVLLGGRLVQGRLQRRCAAAWEAEWRLVEPTWRKRMTG